MSTSQLPLLPLVLDGVPQGLRQALTQEGLAHVERAPGKPAGRFLLYDSRGGKPRGVAPGQMPIDVDALRKAATSDPFEDLLDERSVTVDYPIGGREYRAEIARIDKCHVRQQLMAGLRRAIEQRGGVWLKLSAYPFPYRSCVNLRLNYHTCGEGFAAALRDAAHYERATSHYLSGAEAELQPEQARRLRGLDVGSLGYHRVVPEEADEIVKNLRQGIHVLQRLGLNPRGYAAPHGRFSLPLLTALEVLNVSHSSGVALAYDDLPLFAGSSRVVQLPVHPVAVGRLPDGAPATGAVGRNSVPGDSHEALQEYFRTLVTARYQAGEPVLLLRQATPRVLEPRGAVEALFAATARCGALWHVTLTELAEWWRLRASVAWHAEVAGDQLGITLQSSPGRFRLGAEYWRGEHVALLPLDEAATWFTPGALAYQARRAAPLPAPQRVDGPELPRRQGRRWLSAKRRDDSGVRAFRDWMTRTWRNDRG
ncbi:MAG: hypothetical protein JNG90_20070 [Planctomycetaceae bacterium]|nr:hypothetical protein [Planctomycetaceae bacterium]